MDRTSGKVPPAPGRAVDEIRRWRRREEIDRLSIHSARKCAHGLAVLGNHDDDRNAADRCDDGGLLLRVRHSIRLGVAIHGHAYNQLAKIEAPVAYPRG